MKKALSTAILALLICWPAAGCSGERGALNLALASGSDPAQVVAQDLNLDQSKFRNCYNLNDCRGPSSNKTETAEQCSDLGGTSWYSPERGCVSDLAGDD